MISKVVSHYRILAEAGKGGMGIVYRAEDIRLGRTVAVKFLPEAMARDRLAVERFQREARAVSSLNHPNICTLYDVDTDEGRPFLVMEYLEGQTLSQRLDGPPLRMAELVDLAMQMADALATAHSRGIVHRDIKPANLFVNTRGQIKIMDFGLAKLASASSADSRVSDSQAPTAILDDMLTNPGSTVGTVAYMSPEQARGEELDSRSDLFSLGVVLYEMATGKAPFQGASTALTFVSILHNPPLQPGRLRPDIPASLEQTILKALEKDRDLRYQTASDLRADLARVRREIELNQVTLTTVTPVASRSAVPPVVAPSEPVPSASAPSAVHGIRRNLRLLLIALPVLVVAIAGTLYFGLHDSRIDTLAVLPFVNVTGDPATEYLSDGITESIINNLSETPKLSVRSFSSVAHFRNKDVAPDAAGRELKVRAVIAGRLLCRGDSCDVNAELIDVDQNRQVWGRQYHRRLNDLLAVQEEMSKEISERLRSNASGEIQQHMARRSTGDSAAYQLYLQGRYYWNKRTLDGVQQSIDFFQQAIDKDSRYAVAYAGQADAYALLAELNVLPAKEVMPKVTQAAAKAISLDDTLAEAHTSLGWAKFHDWDWVAAEKEFKRAIELNANYPTAYSWYADYLTALGRWDEARAQLERASALSPVSPVVSLAIGTRLFYARQYDAAIEQMQRTLALDSTFVMGHVFLGRSYEQKNMSREALAEFRKALDLSEGDSNELGALGRALAATHQSAEAQKIVEQLNQRSQQTYVQPMWLAVIYFALGQNDQGFDWAQRAYDDRSSWLVYLKVDPWFDPVRTDPRFIDLVRRVGLPTS